MTPRRKDRGPDQDRRRRTYAAGLWAELQAMLWLSAKGYRVLHRRYLAGGGEVDLVVRRGAVLAFVEVKARPTREEALLAITPAKVARMSRAARVFTGRRRQSERLTLRCDAVVITPFRLPRHHKDIAPLDLG
jgi:putative endonuclease